MDHLQEDIESLEAEKTALKTKLEQASKRAPRAHLTESILAEQASGQPGSVKVIVEDSPATLSKLESLQVRNRNGISLSSDLFTFIFKTQYLTAIKFYNNSAVVYNIKDYEILGH